MGSWNDLSQQVIALTQAELNRYPRSSVYLCGESFGGNIALKVVSQAPELFTHLILANSASSFHRVPWLDLGALLLPWTPRFLYELSSYLALPFLSQVHRLSPIAQKALLKAVQDAPKKTAEQRLELLRTFEMDTAKLAQITLPVLLISGRDDHLLPSVEEAQRLSQIFPNAQQITLPHSGHACLAEADTNLLAILRSTHFLP
jgi:pimeloyl-ACP methyl ester carboxylesterase